MISVCILFGGVSNEHEVSLRSAESVLGNIDRARYEVSAVGITRGGRWLLYDGPAGLIPDGSWESSGLTAPCVISPDRSHGGLLFADGSTRKLDVVFPVLHGKNGEDGTVQGLLELAGIPCVGCGVLASAVCMDKAVAHTLLLAAGIPKTKLVAIRRADAGDLASLEERLRAELGYPMFLKPANAGSSVGITKVKSAEELPAALALAFSIDGKAVAEQAVGGRELECSVMGNNNPVASLVLGEIRARDGFYDYSSKYLDDSAELCAPAAISDADAQKIRAIAVKAYQALGCEGFARVDFFLRDGGGVVLNEINTIPGFTSISMFPRLFIEGGIEYSKIIDALIGYALHREGV